uniref:CASP-like protein n=1 Tax=Setaria viridis TaxID=4556 RepID=A0A4U6VSW4_SETVI|nr:hypothetical protein SEVIR_2G202500v2 [Setaria viridis]
MFGTASFYGGRGRILVRSLLLFLYLMSVSLKLLHNADESDAALKFCIPQGDLDVRRSGGFLAMLSMIQDFLLLFLA